MNLFFPHGNRVLQSPMHALAAEQSGAEAEEKRAGLRPWRMGAVGCMAAKAPGRARRKGSNGRDGLASCMATTRRKRKPHGQRRVAQCERFNGSCGKQSRSDGFRSCPIPEQQEAVTRFGDVVTAAEFSASLGSPRGAMLVGGGKFLSARIGFLAATCRAGRAHCARPPCRSRSWALAGQSNKQGCRHRGTLLRLRVGSFPSSPPARPR